MSTLENALKAILAEDPDAFLSYAQAWKVADLLKEVQTKDNKSGLDWSRFDSDQYITQKIFGFGYSVSLPYKGTDVHTPVFTTPTFARPKLRKQSESEESGEPVDKGGRPRLFFQIFQKTLAQSIEMDQLDVLVRGKDDPTMMEFFMLCGHLTYKVRWDPSKRNVWLIDEATGKIVHSYNTTNNNPETLAKRLVKEINRDMLMLSPGNAWDSPKQK